jgi:CMP-N-acetylneuraminic acid synthetase
MMYYVIPARAGSKGFPEKNRHLFDFTANTIKGPIKPEQVIVSTDDAVIKRMAKSYAFRVHNRKRHAEDNASTRDVLIDVSKHFKMNRRYDSITLLYLTYPGRKFEDITRAGSIFHKDNLKSLLCRFPARTNPYLCISRSGRQFITHDLCNRQEYQAFFEVSHYIAIAKVSELENLNRNLYNRDTYWMDVDEPVDIDTKAAFERFTA